MQRTRSTTWIGVLGVLAGALTACGDVEPATSSLMDEVAPPIIDWTQAFGTPGHEGHPAPAISGLRVV
jgi:hypothetical protein